MRQPLLSILIPTVVGREEQLDSLTMNLIGKVYPREEMFTGQFGWIGCGGQVQVLIIKDDKKITIGEKREQLYKSAQGKYSIQVDDDDELSPNAIELILEAIKNNPDVDCITFDEYCNMDGVEYKSRHSLLYDDWEGDGQKLFPEGVHFRRTPFMKSVIKTEIARSVPIPHIRWAEDHEWSKLLKPHLKTEYHISEQLYRYIHRSSNPEERYGLNKDI